MSGCVLARDGALARVRLSLSDAALTANTAGALADACVRVDADADARVLVLSGDLPRALRLTGEAEHAAVAAAVAVLAAVRKPTLAVIAGAAHGPGLELALACDLRVAAASASFALPQLLEGAMPFLGGTQRLPRAIGRARALDLLLTGRTIDAALAHAWGLVAAVAADDAVEDEGRRVATALGGGAPLAAALVKEAVQAAFDLPLDEGLRLEEDLYALLQTTGDRAEGVRAFLEHRAPRFRGV